MQTRKGRLFAAGRRKASTHPGSIRPRLEVLEDRTAPATLTVTTAADTGVAGDGSLRGEIAAASPGDTIAFASGLNAVNVTNPAGALQINKDLTIQGPSGGLEVINGNGTSGIFAVNKGVTATLNNLQIQNGTATLGGGIFNSGTLTLNNDRVTANTAAAANTEVLGGGIDNAGGTLTINSSTVDGNKATLTAGTGVAAGGGLYNSGKATITNSTFFHNSATSASGSFGGGIDSVASAGVTTTLINSTVAGNSVGGSDTSVGGGIRVGTNGTLNLLNTIVADNKAPADADGPDVSSGGAITAQGDLFGTPSGTGFQIANDLGSEVVGNPLLGPLANNGGPTPTLAVGANSPAFLAGVASSTIGAVPAADQRGFPRLAGSPGVGAFQPALPVTVAITGVTSKFSLLSQTETVNVQVTFLNGRPVTGGQVTITDDGQTQTVGLNNSGQASATFTFQLLKGQEKPSPHTISASFSGMGTILADGQGSAQTAKHTLDFLFQLLFLSQVLGAGGG
jgi:hypothetical protein